MTRQAAELLKEALSLSVSERADLAGSLIESLEDLKDQSVEAAWDEEVARRMADIDSGKTKPISLEDARRRLASALE
jgi:putative addiction module component (TIGR02574 family)